MLLQREVPEGVNARAAALAAAAGVPVVLDCGGVEGPLSSELLRHLTVLSPNETELARLTGEGRRALVPEPLSHGSLWQPALRWRDSPCSLNCLALEAAEAAAHTEQSMNYRAVQLLQPENLR